MSAEALLGRSSRNDEEEDISGARRAANICLRGLALTLTEMQSQTGDSVTIEWHQLAGAIIDGDVDLIDHLLFYGDVKRTFEDDLTQCMTSLWVECSDSQQRRLCVADAHIFADIGIDVEIINATR